MPVPRESPMTMLAFSFHILLQEIKFSKRGNGMEDATLKEKKKNE
jgi:hypothetical protein